MIDFVNDVVRPPDINRDSATIRLITSSFPLIVAHSVNSTYALVLKSALAIARRLRRAGDDLVLVACDQRLLRAAQAEGVLTFNTETQDQAALTALVGP